MKFIPEHYENLKNCIENYLKNNNLSIAEVKAKYEGKGHSETRFLWDLLWLSKWKRIGNYNDAHIQTALKSISQEL